MSLIHSLVNGGATASLERLAEFAEARQKVLSHSIANASTPYYRPEDMDPKSFQAALQEAQERRRRGVNPVRGELVMHDTRELRFGTDGLSAWKPQASNDGILRHDQNNSDLERMMQRLAENTMAHDLATHLLRNQFSMMQTAIRGRL
ncbi:MAG: flagellar basal body rod protein FlgB [Phycisphaeraceae bacterium]|nr:flagellar basal body rod protein FlgB [Phycisphaeraceae bacterium]